MPLCTIEVPITQWSGLPVSGKKEAEGWGRTVLTQTLDLLGIPDPDDKEIRIVTGNKDPWSKVTISFTSGLNEYPGFPSREAFFPSAQQVHALGVVVQALGQESSLRVGQTGMEMWKDTTFLLVDREAQPVVSGGPGGLEAMKEWGRFIDNPKVTLVVSPAIMGQASPAGKESRSGSEPEPYADTARNISKLVMETLGLPEAAGQTSVVEPAIADCDFSMEFDCQPKPGQTLPEPVRQSLAGKVAEYLNSDPQTKKGTAEVWIRQGEPQAEIINASRYSCSVVTTPREMEAALKLRYKVFVEEQKVPEEMEIDEDDKSATHVVVKDEGRVVGTGRMVVEGEKGRIGRVAVDADYRHQDMGTLMMVKLEAEARHRGLNELYLHAQTYANKFYQLLGYRPRGETFDEAGIEHVEMYKELGRD